MSVTLKIETNDKPTQDMIHNWRNMGEDVYLEFRDSYAVSLEEIDASTTSFHVADIKRRQVRRVATKIRNILRKHNFDRSTAVAIV